MVSKVKILETSAVQVGKHTAIQMTQKTFAFPPLCAHVYMYNGSDFSGFGQTTKQLELIIKPEKF